MHPERIESGDIVSVTFTGSDGWIAKAEVLTVPYSSMEPWVLKNSVNGQILYVKTFETMSLMSKKAV